MTFRCNLTSHIFMSLPMRICERQPTLQVGHLAKVRDAICKIQKLGMQSRSSLTYNNSTNSSEVKQFVQLN